MKVAVIGAGGHSRSLCALLERQRISVSAAWDDNFSGKEEIFPDIFLRGKIENCPEEEIKILAFGNNQTRALYLKSLTNIYEGNIIDSSALVDESATLGRYNQIFAFVFINAMVNIGSNNIINSGSIIEHETVIGNNCHISIGTKLGGRVTLGDYCFIGAGAIVIDSVRIVDNVTIGAGAVVVRDILEPGTYIGIPARKIK